MFIHPVSFLISFGRCRLAQVFSDTRWEVAVEGNRTSLKVAHKNLWMVHTKMLNCFSAFWVDTFASLMSSVLIEFTPFPLIDRRLDGARSGILVRSLNDGSHDLREIESGAGIWHFSIYHLMTVLIKGSLVFFSPSDFLIIEWSKFGKVHRFYNWISSLLHQFFVFLDTIQEFILLPIYE